MEGIHPALALAIALAVGVLAQSVARHLRVPGIVLLLLLIAGATLGPDGLGRGRPRDFGDGLHVIVDLAVAVILFEGGLNLEIAELVFEEREESDGSEAPVSSRGGDRFVMLAVQRGEKTEPMSHEHSAKDGDLVTVALHTLEREEALAELAELGWVVVEASTPVPAEATM